MAYLRRIRVVAALAAGLLAMTSAATPAGAQPAPSRGTSAGATAPKGPGATFGLATARQGRIDGRPYFSYEMTPGSQQPDEIAVVNLGRIPVTLHLFATDTTSTSDGSFGLLPTAAKPTQVGTWITVKGPSVVHVPARTDRGPSMVFVPVTVHVPANASPGDHGGGIVVSLIGKAENNGLVHAKLDQRVGLRVYIRITGPVHPALQVSGLHLGYAGPSLPGNPLGDGVATLRYQIRNTGNVVLGATQSATISSWFGSVQVKGLPLVPPLLPGSSVTVTRRVPGIFPGVRLTATVHLTPLAPTGAADPKLATVSASTSIWAVPWELLIIVLILLTGLGVLIWWLWRRRKNPPAASRHSHRPAAVLTRSGGSK